jgi:CrcB protein
MKTILIIGAGSFLGGIVRYLLSLAIQSRVPAAFPYGTFAVNVIGCFLIGVAYELFDLDKMSLDWRLFLATGVLGGFTTFSAFSNETVGLLRDGYVAVAVWYVALSVIIGLLATFAGINLVRM